ncbi:MAG: phosphoribosylglycinamide formyltransferase [Clostridia bacterium]|nr:phosphoribosylglycinamide formyltransferase [Clostridia bacterium]
MKNKIGIAVLVSGGGTNLQALIDAQSSGVINSGKIVCVISSKPGVYALERAEKAGIPHYALDRKAIGRQAFEDETARIIAQSGAKLIVLAGFLSILSADFIKNFPGRIINVHPALIPSFCGKGMYGLKVHEAALGYGVKVTGATVHYVNEIPDGGEIIMQKSVRIYPHDTPEKLQKRVMKQAEWKILPASAEKVCAEILKSEVK